MAPKRQQPARGSAKKTTASEEAPPAEEDAKPNVDMNIVARSAPELPSYPLANAPQPAPTPTPASASPAPSAVTPSIRRLDTLNTSAVGSPAKSAGQLLSRPKAVARRTQPASEQKAKDKQPADTNEAKPPQPGGSGRQEPKWHDRHRDQPGRGRGRGRGRGGYIGSHDRQPREVVASGPFSAGQVERHIGQRVRHSQAPRGLQRGFIPTIGRAETEANRSAAPRSTRSVTADDGSAVKQEAASSTGGKPVVDQDGDVSMVNQRGVSAQDGGYISSDEDDFAGGGMRKNVEDLRVIDLTQDEAPDYDPFAPVRVLRVAHKERTLGINADGATNQHGAITIDANDASTGTATENKRGKTKAKDVEITREKERFQAVWLGSEDEEEIPQIKPDPENAAERIRTPEPVPASESDILPQDPPSSPESRRKGKEKIKADRLPTDVLPAPPEYQTHEELEEWQIHQRDLHLIRKELGVPASAFNQDQNGDATMADVATNPRDGKMYLFQFPPVLPDLAPIRVKPDPEVAANDAEPMDVDPTTTNSSKQITIQDDGNAEVTQPRLPSGAVGRLNIHASGRVTLDWGGTSLSLGMGTEASFLQDVLYAQLPDAKGDAVEGVPGVAMSMGQVKGKFVVTPDWEEILG